MSELGIERVRPPPIEMLSSVAKLSGVNTKCIHGFDRHHPQVDINLPSVPWCERGRGSDGAEGRALGR